MPNFLVALIPAYEPSMRLVTLVCNLLEAGFKIVVVNDGSGVKYERIFDKVTPYAEVISYPLNQGKGYALKRGMEYIKDNYDNSVVITMDSDGQHSVKDAINVSQAAIRDPNVLTLGTRTFNSNTPTRSKLGNNITKFVYALSTGTKVSDTQTGLRAFGTNLIPYFLTIPGKRYEYEMNVLMESPDHNIKFQEVPIETIYFDDNKGSHFRTVRDSFLVYSKILKFIASSFTGFIVDYSLYTLLVTLLSGFNPTIYIPLSNIVARIISATTNFTINRNFVFKNKDSALKTGLQYFILAACILAGNTLLLSFMVNTLGLNKYAAKIITEVTFFALSFLGQRFVIFRKKNEKAFNESKGRSDIR